MNIAQLISSSQRWQKHKYANSTIFDDYIHPGWKFQFVSLRKKNFLKSWHTERSESQFMKTSRIRNFYVAAWHTKDARFAYPRSHHKSDDISKHDQAHTSFSSHTNDHEITPRAPSAPFELPVYDTRVDVYKIWKADGSWRTKIRRLVPEYHTTRIPYSRVSAAVVRGSLRADVARRITTLHEVVSPRSLTRGLRRSL